MQDKALLDDIYPPNLQDPATRELMADLEYLRQLHEPFLADLEGLVVEAIASGEWKPVYTCIGEFNGTISTWTPEDYAEAKLFIDQLLTQTKGVEIP